MNEKSEKWFVCDAADFLQHYIYIYNVDRESTELENCQFLVSCLCAHQSKCFGVLVGVFLYVACSIYDTKHSSFYWSIGLVERVFASDPGDWGSISGRVIPKTQKKWYFIPPYLTLSIMSYL